MTLARRVLTARNALLALASLGALGLSTVWLAPEPSFEVDGADVSRRFPYDVVSLEGRAGSLPEEGDLVRIGRVPSTRGPGPFRIAIEPDPVARTAWLVRRARPRRLVAMSVEPETRARFLALSPGEVAGLWGLRVTCWDDAIAAQVARIDPERTCLTLEPSTATVTSGLPLLPEGLRALAIRWGTAIHGREKFEDLSGLRRLRALRFLDLSDADALAGVDARDLAGHPELRALLLRPALHHPEALGPLPELRTLDLRAYEGVDASFLGGMPALRSLDVAASRVEDLSALAPLAHLVRIDARRSRVAKLPLAAFPELESADFLSSWAREPEVRALAQANPRARVLGRWEDPLREVLARTTRLRVHEGGAGEGGKELFLVREPAGVRAFGESIELEREGSTWCMCSGDPSVELFAGDELVATLSMQHGTAIRWRDVWTADAPLTDASMTRLKYWFSTRGGVPPAVPSPPPCEPLSKEHAGRVSAVAFSPSGQLVASAGWDSVVKLWDAAALRAGEAPLRAWVATVSTTSTAHTSFPHPKASEGPGVRSLAFTPDGRSLVTGDFYGGLTLWDVETGRELGIFDGLHDAPIMGIAFSSDGERFATGSGRSGEGSVDVWEVASRRRVAHWECEEVDGFAASADLSRLITTHERQSVLWDGAWTKLASFRGLAWATAMTPDGRKAAISEGSRLRLVDVEAKAVVWSHDWKPERGFATPRFVGDRLVVVLCDDDAKPPTSQLLTLDLGTGEVRARQPLSVTPRTFLPCDVSRDGRWLVAADGRVPVIRELGD